MTRKKQHTARRERQTTRPKLSRSKGKEGPILWSRYLGDWKWAVFSFAIWELGGEKD
jgi:hypothetical protein